jgi:hypothetical protein
VSDRNPTNDYDLNATLAALRTYWWLVALVPALVVSILIVRNLTADFESSFSATVLLPGDLEIPGSAERPELMILDDIGPVVASQAFAGMVATQAGLRPSDVQGTLSASRYSRVVTVTASDESEDRALLIAEAANAVLPQAINQLMVADGAQPATVQTIDRPSAPIRGDANKWTVTAIAAAVSLVSGVFAALVFDALTGSNMLRQHRPVVAEQ